MTTGAVTVLDSGAATYERLTWTEKGDGLAVLKGTDDRALRDKRYAVLGFTGLGAGAPRKIAYDPAADTTLPEGMTVSGNREPRWTDDLQALLFGIHIPRQRDARPTPTDGRRRDTRHGAARAATGRAAADDRTRTSKVDLVLWHWQDSAPAVAAAGAGSSAIATSAISRSTASSRKKFIRLADEDVRTVTRAPKDRWAIGIDDREYELIGNLDGRRFQDVYAIDLQTGERKLAAQARALVQRRVARRHVVPLLRGRPLPRLLDGRPARRATSRRARRSSFIDTEDDHNVVKPPTAVDRLGERQQVGAAARQLGRLAGAGRRRARPSTSPSTAGRTRSAISAASRSSRRRIATRASISRSRCTSAPTASGRRRPASRASIRASRACRC